MKSFNRFLRKFRAVNSLFLILLAIPVALSSAYLYIAPYDAAGRTTWYNLHLFLGFVLIVSFIVHGAMNWRAIRSYLRQKTQDVVRPRGEGLIAVSVFTVLVLGVIAFPAFLGFMQARNVPGTDTGTLTAANLNSCGSCPFLRSYGSCHGGTRFSLGNTTFIGSDNGESYVEDASYDTTGAASNPYSYYGAN